MVTNKLATSVTTQVSSTSNDEKTNIPYKINFSFPITIPLPHEDFVAAWQTYQEISQTQGVWQTLKTRLVQLQFPIQQNISVDVPAYRAATRQGKSTTDIPTATGLILEEPEKLQLHLHTSIAGLIPVLITANHSDFASLVQALAKKNEPVPIPKSMGAYMIAGYNNWDRVRTYRRTWEIESPLNHSEIAWKIEFKQLVPQKHRYQDRFILLSTGPYSGIEATDLDLKEKEWLNLSLTIRLEHECTHYFTKRFFGVIRNHVFDELLADYAGIVGALGYYQADWFLQFMGLENFPNYRLGGRLQNYLPNLTPADKAFQEAQTQLKLAAETLEQFDALAGPSIRNPEGHMLMLLTITRFTLAELATPTIIQQLQQTLSAFKQKQKGK